MKRLLTAAVAIPLFILYVLRLPPVFYAGLILLVSCGALAEFYSMYGLRKQGPVFFASLLLGAATLAAGFVSGRLLLNSLVLSIAVISLMRLFLTKTPESSLRDVSYFSIGIFYVPLLLSFQFELVKASPQWIIFLYGSLWAADSMARYLGKAFGRKKLYESMSPNKTVVGAWASVAGGVLGAYLMRFAMTMPVPLPETAMLGAVVGGAAIAGDLVESMFKRDAGVKDSSGIIPGHGGMLDKVDAVLFAGPALYWALRVAGRLSPGVF